ncbi:MAG: hypothetical protein IPG10_05950 [Flavobacteriales bacterium]|nr:hypothetical protein [Flavobacteriales bacterium]MBK6754964.1 hypothetical protein [Flavobacteriales bacterium]MBK7271080.1 hypothetical protein [Flavobacteriales bacterium]MBK9074923.1 hypothetical protein [Flavobacteriales bacterium]MBK9540217.1 hypothetical protein [Flavobacteriales bacterium]
MERLHQKQWPEFKIYELRDDGLQFEAREEHQYINTLIEFEQIGTKELILNKKPNLVSVIAFISVFFNAISLLIYVSPLVDDPTVLGGVGTGITTGLSFWAISLFKSSKQKVLQGGRNIGFFYNKKQRADVDRFIVALESKRRSYLRAKFMHVDKHTPEPHLMSRFLWLRDAEIISESELDALVLTLENRRLIDGQ